MPANAYANAKGRAGKAESGVAASRCVEEAPLTAEELEKGRENWRLMTQHIPFFAEFVAEFAKRPRFNGRRQLAQAKVRVLKD